MTGLKSMAAAMLMLTTLGDVKHVSTKAQVIVPEVRAESGDQDGRPGMRRLGSVLANVAGGRFYSTRGPGGSFFRCFCRFGKALLSAPGKFAQR